ncbi:hypothetical protein D9M71_615120 [compost metagenome]
MVDVGEALVVGVGVDGGHQALLDDQLAVQHLGNWRQAVGGARGAGDDLVRRAQNVVIDPVNDGRVGALGRCRDDDFARPGSKMSSCLGAVGEVAGAFEHYIDGFGLPRQLGRVANGTDGNAVAIDGQAFVIELDIGSKDAMNTVVLEQVRIDRAVTQVIDRDDLQVLTVALGIECAKDVAADAAKAIDCDTKGHRATSGRPGEARGTWEIASLNLILLLELQDYS